MKIALLFPGYGSQFVGMAKELYDDSRIVQEYFEEASNCLGTNFVKLCFASSDADLMRIDNAYTTLFLVSSAIGELIKSQGITPDLVAGYNQGEYAALFVAGGFSFPDGLYLLSKYVGFYQDALNGMDVAVISINGVPATQIQDLCFSVTKGDQLAFIALYHDAAHHIVAGTHDAIAQLQDKVASEYDNAIIEDRSVDLGLHCPLMDGVMNQFKVYLEKVDCHDLKIPFMSSIDGRIIQTAQAVREHIVDHIHSAMVWPLVVKNLADYDLIIEAGPGRKLSDMVRTQYPDKEIIAINKHSDLDELKALVPNISDTRDEHISTEE